MRKLETEEIGKNQEVINSFANATRIEQEAIAGALGMSREQMADMVLQSDLINNLTDKQRAIKSSNIQQKPNGSE